MKLPLEMPSLWNRLIADETALHFDELLERGIPENLARVMARDFHAELAHTVLDDEQFKPVIAKILGPVHEGAPSVEDDDEDSAATGS